MADRFTLDEWAVVCLGGLVYPPPPSDTEPLLTLRPKTRRNYIDKYRIYIRKPFGNRDMCSITRREVQTWINKYEATVQWAVYPVLQSLFREAMNDPDHALTMTPCFQIKKKKKKPYRRPYVPVDEVLKGKFTRGTREAVFFLALHGLRLSEAMNLDPDTQIVDGYVYVERSADGDTTKSGKGRRVPYRGYFPAKWPGECTLRRALYNEYPGRHISPHSLRKAFAIECKRAGLSDEVIMELMGHANIEITKRSYSEYLLDEEDEAATLLRARHDGRTSA